jgi:hypothetical protein
LKLRTFDSESVKGKLTTEYPLSRDGLPVLVVDDQPFSPEEAEFFIESATEEELELLGEGGYELPDWEEKEEDSFFLFPAFLVSEGHVM